MDMTLGRSTDGVRGPEWLLLASLDAEYVLLVCAGPWISHLGLSSEQLEIRGFNLSLSVFGGEI